MLPQNLITLRCSGQIELTAGEAVSIVFLISRILRDILKLSRIQSEAVQLDPEQIGGTIVRRETLPKQMMRS